MMAIVLKEIVATEAIVMWFLPEHNPAAEIETQKLASNMWFHFADYFLYRRND